MKLLFNVRIVDNMSFINHFEWYRVMVCVGIVRPRRDNSMIVKNGAVEEIGQMRQGVG